MDTPRPSVNVEEDQTSISTTDETLISRTKNIPHFTPEPFILSSKDKYRSNDSLTIDEYFVCPLKFPVAVQLVTFSNSLVLVSLTDIPNGRCFCGSMEAFCRG